MSIAPYLSVFFDDIDEMRGDIVPKEKIAHYVKEIPDILVESIIVAGSYESFRKQIELYKYASQREYAQYFAQIYHTMIQDSIKNPEEYVIVPVPMHWSRYIYRWFDHMALICDILRETYGYRSKKLLSASFTWRQAKLTKQQRRKNRESGIFLRFPDFPEKNIILIDDIISSGYTLSSCSKLLKKYPDSHIVSYFIASNSY
jgi:ComF family protein